MKILVPFDFSEEALHSLGLGSEMANQLNYKLKILHCLNLPDFSYGDPGKIKAFRKDLSQEAMISLKSIIKGLNDRLVDVDIEINEGSASANILKATFERDIRYTIMGFKKRMIPDKIGSTTRDLLRYANGSILCLKNELPLKSIKNILLVTDFTGVPAKAMENINLLQKLNNARLDLLYINTRENWLSTKDTHNKMKVFCKTHDLKNTALDIVNDETVELGVLDKLMTTKVDLIAIKINKSSDKIHITDTHLSAERIIENTDIPVLTYAHTSIYQ